MMCEYLAVKTRDELFAHGGDLALLMSTRDWSIGPLGPPSRWPATLRTLVRVILDAKQPMLIVWGAGRTMLYNNGYAEMCAERHPEALGQSLQSVWPDVWADIAPIFDRAYAGEALYLDGIAHTLKRRGQIEEAYFAFGYTPIRDDAGTVTGVLCVGTETTSQQKAALQYAAELKRLSQMFDQAPSFMALLSGPEHRIVLANRAYLRLVGGREVVGLTVEIALPDAVAQGYLRLLDNVFASAEPYRARGARYAAQNVPGAQPEERFVDFVYQPILNDDARVIGIFVEGADVSDRIAAEAALRDRELALLEANLRLEERIAERTARLSASETLIRTFFEHSSECHAVLRESADTFVYEEINPATLSLYGRTREQVIGRTLQEVVGIEAAPTLAQHLKTTLLNDGPYHYERAQAENVVEAVATPVPPESGTGRRIVVSARDITERRRLEQQLRQSQKMEAVGQLTGGLAHDFNNLLAGITGSLELIQARVAQGRMNELDRFIHSAQGAARRAAGLTHRLLAFARRQTLDAKPTNVNRLVMDMEELIRRSIGPQIKLEVVGAIGIWHVSVDSNQLENALLNLSINARDAMPDGGKITIETGNRWLDERAALDRELPAGQYVSLCVSDTGTGMSKDVIGRAFDPFFTTKPIGEGTGLGLSMVYGFARQSGGQARIYSEIGQGTMVCIYLPRHRGREDAAEDIEEAAPESLSASGATVLVVDDEPTVRLLIVEVLKELGCTALEAADGVAALKILQSNRRIELLITDVGLPGGINGRQLADAGRALRQELNVLFITGYAENAVVGHGYLETGFEILTKPFAITTLVKRVSALLAKGSAKAG
jgi:PAS domain S-box-containing protein